MIKKILGIIFIIISIFFGLAFLIGIPENISLLLVIISGSSGYSIGYFIGNIFVAILILLISIYLFKLGLKWLKNKSKNQNIIDEIGKN